MRFRVLGEVDVECDGSVVRLGGPQQRRLLALLLSERGRTVSIDRLVEALWSDREPPDGAARSVMKYVSRLRAALGEAVVVTSGAGYRLELGEHGCDADEFEALVEAARTVVPDVAIERYEAALGLWRGGAYGEFAGEWWARPEALRLDERRTAAAIARAAAQMAMGHHNRAIPDLERLSGECPLDERPVRLLMQALQATGRQAEALRAGHALRQRLAEETGLDVSDELVRLERAIAAGAAATEPIGRPLRGYTIHDAIGEGAHGRVYVATQPGTQRRVAIKAIRADLADSSEFVHRFEAEAQLVARLEHPHIVPLYDYWREPGGAYLVFRLLPGGTARESVVSGGPWSLLRVAQLVEEIGSALMFAHGAGVAHHDVKPSNVLLDDAGVAYLSDFGIAVTADDTSDGAIADIRGLGWTAWELLTGSRPHLQRDGSSVDVPNLVGRMLTVPDGLDAVLRRGIDGGYHSVAEFVLAWRAVAGAAHAQHSPITSDLRQAAARQLAQATTAGVNPYRGLRPFGQADAASFHGRDGHAAELIELVGTRRFVSIVGASGSGKSSVVLAGLIPRLRARGDIVVTMVAGAAPVEALQAALTDVATTADSTEGDRPADLLAELSQRAGRIVVVIDQFEECWTSARPAERDAFVDVVADVVAQEGIDVRFVSTVRADLLDRPLEDPKIGALVGAGSYVLAPLSSVDLERAIVQPAARVGVTFDPGVVAELIGETLTHPGSLPLLQFTLTELYDRRVDGVIGAAALAAIGGMAGAVGRRAEEVYLALDEPLRIEARQLFSRLVTPGDNAPDTRRRALLGELSPAMREVADRFVAARLLVADRDPASREPTVEVAHEALLTRWSRLLAWVGEDRRWLSQLQHLADAASAWNDGGRPEAELYRGARLEAAIEATEVDGRPVTPVERQFIEAGRDARDVEIHTTRRTSRRLRRLLVAVAAALVVALVAGAVALGQRRQAEDSAVAAEIEALVGRAESLRATQRDAAALLAIEAFRLADTPRTRSALFGTFTDQSGFYDARRLGGTGGGAGIVMPDGESAYLVDGSGRLRPYGLDTGTLGDPLPAIGEAAGGASVLAGSADGRWLARAWRSDIGDGPTRVGVFDTRTGALTFAPVEIDGAVWSAAFTQDAGELALAVGEEARLVVLDRDTGEQRIAVEGVELPPRGGEVGMEPQTGTVGPVRRPPAVVAVGDELLLGAADGSLRVFDAASFELRHTLALAPDTLTSLRPLADGTLLAAGRGGVARIELTDGRVRWQRDEGFSSVGSGAAGSRCAHLAVIEPRTTFYCGNAFGRLAEHDLDSGYPIRILDAQDGNSSSVWPARNGTELVSFGDNEAVVSRWRLDGSGQITHLVTPGFRVWEFSPNGDLVLVERGAPQGLSFNQVVAVESGEVVHTLDGLFNPDWIDDDTVTGAIVNANGQIETALVELPAGEPIGDGFIVEDPQPNSANYEPGKDRMLVEFGEGADATLLQFDPLAREPGPEIAVTDYVTSAISRSGHRIAAGTARGVEIFDGFTGELVDTIPGPHLRTVFITVTDQLFVSSISGELVMYDLDTLEPVRSFGGSRGSIVQVEGTADGSIIATNGGDHHVILYDVATGTRIGSPISIPDGDTNLIALSLDGRWLATGGEPLDGQRASKIWNLDPEVWMTAACRVAGRNLTREEWASHIGSLAPYRATCPDAPAGG